MFSHEGRRHRRLERCPVIQLPSSSTDDRPLLALETSGNALGVALCSRGQVVFDENVTEGMIHGRALVPLMQAALASQNLKPADLGAVAVSQGPGSWTGLRIGISAAKAFAWASNLPLVCVPSFEAMALEACGGTLGGPARNGAVLTLRDARSEGFFVAIFDVTDGVPTRLLEECVLKPDAVVEAAKRLGRSALHVCGDAKCLELLAADIRANGWTALPDAANIPGRAVALSGWRRLQSGAGVARTAAEIHAIGPMYLRASDPELKLKQV